MNNAALTATRAIAEEFSNPKFRVISTRKSSASPDVHRVEKLIDGEWRDISGPLSSYHAATEIVAFEQRHAVRS